MKPTTFPRISTRPSSSIHPAWRPLGAALALAWVLASPATARAGANPSPAAAPADASMAHADHAARHGGILLMDGDLHFEVVVGFDGRHTLYFSGAHREPLPEGAIRKVRLTVQRDGGRPELLNLQASPGGVWRATGRAIDGDQVVVRVAFWKRGSKRPYWIDVPVTAAAKPHHHGA